MHKCTYIYSTVLRVLLIYFALVQSLMSVAGLSGDGVQLVEVRDDGESSAVISTASSQDQQNLPMARNTSRAR